MLLDGGGLPWLGRICFAGRWGTVGLNRCTVPGTRRVYLFSGYIYSCLPAPSCHPYFRTENVCFRHSNLELANKSIPTCGKLISYFPRFHFLMTLEKYVFTSPKENAPGRSCSPFFVYYAHRYHLPSFEHVPDTLQSTLSISYSLILQQFWRGKYCHYPHIIMRKLGLGYNKWLAQGHTVCKRHKWDLNTG